MLQVSVDGGVTYVDAPDGVQVIAKVATGASVIEVHLNATHEGLITDVWQPTRGVALNLGTSSEMYDEMATRLAGVP